MKSSTENIARHYFELSNRGELDAISQLFQAEATYSSDHTGLYFGVKDIMTMMRSFFAAHHHIQWHIEALTCLTEHIVEIKFTCQSIDHQGIKTARQGTERLVVTEQLIRHIEVRSH